MDIFEGRIKFSHDCWTPYVSKKFPDVLIIMPKVVHMWDGYLTSICYVYTKSRAELNDFLATCNEHKSVKSINSAPINRHWTKLYIQSVYDESNYSTLEELGGIDTFWYAIGGFEESTFIAKNRQAFHKIISELKKCGDVKIVSQGKRRTGKNLIDYLHPFDLVVLEFLLDLTEKQELALRLAIETGYYGMDKKTDLKVLSKRMGISVQSYREHLRKAEKKLMERLPELLDKRAELLQRSPLYGE